MPSEAPEFLLSAPRGGETAAGSPPGAAWVVVSVVSTCHFHAFPWSDKTNSLGQTGTRQTSNLDRKIQLYTYRMGKIQPENKKSHKNSVGTFSSHKLTVRINTETELSWHLRCITRSILTRKREVEITGRPHVGFGLQLSVTCPRAFCEPILATTARFTGGLGASFLDRLSRIKDVEGAKRGSEKSWPEARKLVSPPHQLLNWANSVAFVLWGLCFPLSVSLLIGTFAVAFVRS